MYVPPAFREDDPDRIAALIAAHPLALLISYGTAGLSVSPVPMQLNGTVLRAHLARANPQLADLRAGGEVVAVFQGPQTYVTPAWYASKAEHGRVVPTWNYLTVEVRGTVTVIEDAAWLHQQITDLTQHQEAPRGDAAWAVTDAPDAFIAAQLRGIFGVEIAITAMTGKWKASQNRPEGDRVGVIDGLAALNTDAARGMAQAIPPAAVQAQPAKA